MKNAIFLVVLGILLCGLGFSEITVSITNPTQYGSPDLSFNAVANTQSSAGTYITIINLSILGLDNSVQATYSYTNSNTSIRTINYTFPITTVEGNYKINISVENNITESNSSLIEIYPRTLIYGDSWLCTPPANCIYETFTHSNGQKFYIVKDNNTCSGLGIGQLLSNIQTGYTNSLCATKLQTETNITNYNKEISKRMYFNSSAIGCASGGCPVSYYEDFVYNKTANTTHIINFNVLETGSTLNYGAWINITMKNGTTTQVIFYKWIISNTPTYQNNITCRFNITNATCDGVGGFNISYSPIPQGTVLRFSVEVKQNYTSSCGSGQPINVNITINTSNPFLEEYVGFGGLGAVYRTNNADLISCPIIANNISSPQPTVRILMYYNNQVIYPYLYYAIVVPNKSLSENTMGIYNSNIYLPSTTQINSYNNSIIYVYSREFSSWFLIPPFNLDPSGIYIVNLVYDTGVFGVGQNGTNYTGGYTRISAVPELPLLEMCNYINNTYYIRSEYQRTKTFQLNTWINNTFYANISSAYSLNTNLNTVNISAIQFYVDGFKRCEWIANQTSLAIGNVDLRPDMITTNIFFDVGLILLVGLSAISPAILLPALAYNDFFQIIPITQMAFLTIFVAIISYITNWGGNRNMKTMLCLMAMGIAMLTYFSIDTGGGYSMQYSSAYGNNTINVSSIDHDIKALSVVSQSGINWNSLAQLVSTGIQLIIDLLAFIIQIPALMLGVLSGLLFNLSPPLATAVSFFIPYLLIGLIGWLVLKAYDMFQKPYMPT